MRIHIQSEKSFQLGAFAHFIATTDSNYSKILQIERVVSLLHGGANDSQFCVAIQSSDLYASEIDFPADRGAIIVLAEKGVSAEQFWDQVRYLHRPTIFFRRNTNVDWHSGRVRPLYSPADPSVLKVVIAEVQSPIRITFEGLDRVIRQLRFGQDEQRRMWERHDLELERQRLENAERRARVARETVSVVEKIESSRLSRETKRRLSSMVDSISNRQEDLVNRLGPISVEAESTENDT